MGHENKHTKTRRQRVYARTLHLFPPPEAFLQPKVVFISFVSLFFLYRERREIELMKMRILVTKIVFSGRSNLYHRRHHRCARSRPLVRQAMVCAGDERNALKCAL